MDKHILKRYIFIFLAFFVSVYIIVINSIELNNKNTLDIYLQKDRDINKKNLEVLQSSLEEKSRIFYYYLMNNDKFLKIMKDINSNEREIDFKRLELEELLRNDYNFMKDFGIEQFHFHLLNGDSFLRLHKKGVYGDNLNSVRKS